MHHSSYLAFCSHTLLHFQITENLTIVDPTPEEEECGPVQVVVGVTPGGLITALQQLGHGTFTTQTLSAAIKVVMPSTTSTVNTILMHYIFFNIRGVSLEGNEQWFT